MASCPTPMSVVLLAPLPRRPYQFGAWRSLVAHLHGVQGVAGSNPAVPTNFEKAYSEQTVSLFYCLLYGFATWLHSFDSTSACCMINSTASFALSGGYL